MLKVKHSGGKNKKGNEKRKEKYCNLWQKYKRKIVEMAKKMALEERKGGREEWSTGVDRNSITTFFLDKNQCYKSNSVSSLYI